MAARQRVRVTGADCSGRVLVRRLLGAAAAVIPVDHAADGLDSLARPAQSDRLDPCGAGRADVGVAAWLAHEALERDCGIDALVDQARIGRSAAALQGRQARAAVRRRGRRDRAPLRREPMPTAWPADEAARAAGAPAARTALAGRMRTPQQEATK